MAKPFSLAVIGVGRIGIFHARHVQELARERGDCALVAVVWRDRSFRREPNRIFIAMRSTRR